jgi:poly(A) polymerase
MKFPPGLPIDDIKFLCSILAKMGESRLVGGCVRNILIFESSTDIDIATQVEPEQVMLLLRKSGVKCIPTGIKHGTITAIYQKQHYEITTLRRDVETFGRHAEVAFTDDWEEDAKRRDFTMNAMFIDMNGNLYDYYKGQQDLAQKLIRFVGDPEARIHEDYLRILRYFRFYSYFGGNNLDKDSIKACEKLAYNMDKLSGERIQLEMLKIISSKFAMEALALMNKTSVLKVLELEIRNDKFWGYRLGADSIVNLAALLRCCAKPHDTLVYIKSRWKLANKTYDLLDFLVNLPFEADDVNQYQLRLLYQHGLEKYIAGVKLLAVETKPLLVDKLIAQAESAVVPKFPINGDDMLKIGYAGKAMGVVLKQLEKAWVESDFKLSKAQLLALAEQQLKK